MLPRWPTRPSPRSVKELRDAGVKVLLGSEGYEPHVPAKAPSISAIPAVVLAAVATNKVQRGQIRGGYLTDHEVTKRWLWSSCTPSNTG